MRRSEAVGRPPRRTGVSPLLLLFAGGVAGALIAVALLVTQMARPSTTPQPAAALPPTPIAARTPESVAAASVRADDSTPPPLVMPTLEPAAVRPTPTPPPVALPPTSPPAAVPSSVDRALARLTTDVDLVGQVLLLGWQGNTADQARETLVELRPGGLVYVDNTTRSATAAAINAGVATIAAENDLLPLVIAIDHEGGIVQRLTDLPNLGSNQAFAAAGATGPSACERGTIHARQLQQLGFNMNLAPVLDVNNNPANPVIGTRSYGREPEQVATLGAAYVRGLQGHGILAVGKHFPGHGNTSVDSHLALPMLPFSQDALEQTELVPFRRAIDAATDIAAIMSAHIVFPALDGTEVPATLSRPIMTGLLRDTLGFRGLTLSDDLAGMKAITDNYAAGDAAVRAIGAGVDMLIIAGGVPRQRVARDALLAALATGQLPRARLVDAVHNVLTAKARVGLLGDAPAAAGPCA
jgi:beta-N-acetylhexosaminidase